MVVEKLHIYMQKNQRRLLSHTTYKNSKRIKDLNVRPEIIKLLEENLDSMLFDISLSNIVFGSISSGKGNKKQN